MIGLDTSVLVRYLVQDDPEQSARATALIEQRLTEDEPGFISIIAMVETVWVLTRAYKVADAGVASAIEHLLQADALVVEREQDVFVAMIALKQGRGAFADALIEGLGRRAGCSHTVTLDRAASRLPGFELL